MTGIKNAALVVILVVLTLLVVEFNSRMAELKRLEAEQVIVAEQYNQRVQKKAELEVALNYALSDAAVYDYAYDHNMTRKGDIPVVPIQAYASTPVPEPAPEVIVIEETNWQRWLSLFADTNQSR